MADKLNLSKSRYIKGVQCPKMLWMDLHMREQFDESTMDEAILSTGNEVGDLAMGYYGDYVEVEFDGRDFDGMVARTQELLDAGTPVICEATFAYEGNLCMVDILRVEEDGVHIVEVKSTAHPKDIHYHDMAYQTWILQQCGLAVKSVSLMHLNNQYVRNGELDLSQLFVVRDCTVEVADMLYEVPFNVGAMQAVATQGAEPDLAVGQQCKSPYECGYRGWCWRNVPTPSVFDLSRIHMERALDLQAKGIVTLPKALEAGLIKSLRQRVQAECEVRDVEEIVDGKKVSEFLGTLSFPLYFLDFETWQPAIPPFDGAWPYEQIPTQYSLHVLREPDGKLEHYEFLASEHGDPRRSVAEHLVADIPMDICTLAYNMGFEKGCLRDLAELNPDLAAHLTNIADNMRDLIVPFQKGWYHNRSMGGSNSIKVVLPALFPNEPELDYHELEGVHNGVEAMNAFAALASMPVEEVARTREQLLRYCELDTYAMVRIWQRLRDVAEGR